MVLLHAIILELTTKNNKTYEEKITYFDFTGCIGPVCYADRGVGG